MALSTPLRTACVTLSCLSAGVGLSLSAAPTAPAAEALHNDLATVAARLRERERARPLRFETVKPWLDALQADGRWPDLNYTDRDNAIWSPATHMERLRLLAVGSAAGALTPEQASLARGAALRALDHWLAHDYTCPNWWYNQIGVPRSLYRALLFLETELTPEQKAGALRILERGKLGMTGQNLVWVAEVSIARACLAGLPELAAEAFQRIANEVRITTGEGIQADSSFHQHGAQLYSGGYGRGFSIDVAAFAALAAGTVFAFPPERLDILSGYLLDGQQWLVRGPLFDPSACGREITRQNACSSSGLAAAARHLAALELPRQAEFERFAARLEGAGTPLVGHKHFWRADLTVHHRPEFYASVRVTSPRLVQSELVNSENLLGRHLADGVTYLVRRGDEYHNLFGVWDWKRLPGITVELDGEPPALRNGQRGSDAFAGGVSDGRIGVTAMAFRRGALEARKAWFFFADAVVCLGAGIRCASPHPVLTMVNQCHLRGEATASPVETAGTRWVWHDGLAYLFPGDQQMVFTAGPQKGSWRRISHSYPEAEETLPVFSLWLEHGRTPAAATYVTVVSPADGPETAQRQAGALPVEIVANRDGVQAVVDRDHGAAGVVFAAAGSIALPGFGEVAADRPCLVSLARTEAGLRVAAGDPAQATGTLALRIGSRTAAVSLPEGQQAGSSVVLDWAP
jgi:chondroitin AC lyase